MSEENNPIINSFTIFKKIVRIIDEYNDMRKANNLPAFDLFTMKTTPFDMGRGLNVGVYLADTQEKSGSTSTWATQEVATYHVVIEVSTKIEGVDVVALFFNLVEDLKTILTNLVHYDFGFPAPAVSDRTHPELTIRDSEGSMVTQEYIMGQLSFSCSYKIDYQDARQGIQGEISLKDVLLENRTVPVLDGFFQAIEAKNEFSNYHPSQTSLIPLQQKNKKPRSR